MRSLNEIKNLGKTRKNEIIDTLKALVHIVYDEESSKEKRLLKK